jgi:hypothetical protein
LAGAFALTALALPLLFKESRTSQDGRPSSVGAIPANGGNIAGAIGRASSTATDDPATADSPTATVLPTDTPSTTEIVIAVPTSPPDGQVVLNGKAGYQTWRSSLWARPCAFPKAAETTKLTVTNLDNGKATTCTVVSNATPAGGMALVMDSSVFTEIADLLEAPVPVRITWNP